MIGKLSQILNIPEDEIETILSKAKDSYKKFEINKKTGGKRKIFQPSKSLKSIQYAFINLYLSNLPVHDYAYSYKKGLKSPLKVNAEKHKGFKYNVKIDFKDFFPSIKLIDIINTLKRNNFKISSADEKILDNMLIPKGHISLGLPIGAPVSPILSNIVMYNLDKSIYNISKKFNGDNCVTRYADDITFSSNTKINCKKFHSQLKSLLKQCKSPNLNINEEKTKYYKKGNRQTITGLILTPDKKISIGRKKKRYIKKLLFDYSKGILDEKDISKVKGYLAYIYDVESRFYESLVMKYGRIVNEIIKYS